MKVKYLGFALIFVATIMSFFVYFFHEAVHEIAYDEIEKNPQCSNALKIVEGHNNFHSKITTLFSIIVFLTGIYLTFFDKIHNSTKPNILKKNYKSELEKIKKTLTNEENLVFDEIIKSKGEILQTALQERTNLNKVKITRILTKLENKKIISRKRYGMTKMILLERREE